MALDPNGDMQAKAMKDALKTAKALPEEIDYVNADGNSTPLNDLAETSAIKKSLGEPGYNISVSCKSSFGLGGRNAAIVLASIMHKPPNTNFFHRAFSFIFDPNS